eukprot:13739739-Alexandrium_andersonii.AAC.1
MSHQLFRTAKAAQTSPSDVTRASVLLRDLRARPGAAQNSSKPVWKSQVVLRRLTCIFPWVFALQGRRNGCADLLRRRMCCQW